MGQQVSELLPAPLGGSPLECEGRRDRLTGHGQLRGQPPGMPRGLSPGHARLWGLRPQMVSVGQERRHLAYIMVAGFFFTNTRGGHPP
jgi:hypothetical protein